MGDAPEVMSYDEFGMPANADGSADRLGSAGGLGYIGYRADDISGTYFAQAREYRPEAGRFMSRDLLKGYVERPVSLNEYAYCHGNPATNNFIDKGVGATESWLIGKGIDRGEVEVTHRIAAHGIARPAGRYEADISRQIRKPRIRSS